MGKLFKDDLWYNFEEGAVYTSGETRKMKRNYVEYKNMSKEKGPIIPIVVKGKKRYLRVPEETYEKIMQGIKQDFRRSLNKEFSANQKFVQELQVNSNKKSTFNPYDTYNADIEEDLYR